MNEDYIRDLEKLLRRSDEEIKLLLSKSNRPLEEPELIAATKEIAKITNILEALVKLLGDPKYKQILSNVAKTQASNRPT